MFPFFISQTATLDSPVPHFIDGMHHPLDVVLGPAPGLGSDGTRHGVLIIFRTSQKQQHQQLPATLPTTRPLRTFSNEPRWLSGQIVHTQRVILYAVYSKQRMGFWGHFLGECDEIGDRCVLGTLGSSWKCRYFPDRGVPSSSMHAMYHQQQQYNTNGGHCHRELTWNFVPQPQRDKLLFVDMCVWCCCWYEKKQNTIGRLDGR